MYSCFQFSMCQLWLFLASMISNSAARCESLKLKVVDVTVLRFSIDAGGVQYVSLLNVSCGTKCRFSFLGSILTYVCIGQVIYARIRVCTTLSPSVCVCVEFPYTAEIRDNA